MPRTKHPRTALRSTGSARNNNPAVWGRSRPTEQLCCRGCSYRAPKPVSYTHLRAHETSAHL
eukprot:13293245-Alexandrium_andersonii.AAC.1